MHKTPLFLLALTLGGLTLGSASAQSAQDILNRVESTQKSVKDFSFRLSGSASVDGVAQNLGSQNFGSQNLGSQKLDLTVRAIPAQNLARIQFAAPDALADNIVVVDRQELRQYLFLTNQIMVMPLSKASSQSGLQGGGLQSGLGNLDFTQLTNPATLLAGFNVKLLSTSGRAGQRTFELQAQAKQGGNDRTHVWITEAGWRPTRVQLMSSGKTVADLNVSNYKVNTGLSAASLRQLPKSAQIVRP